MQTKPNSLREMNVSSNVAYQLPFLSWRNIQFSDIKCVHNVCEHGYPLVPELCHHTTWKPCPGCKDPFSGTRKRVRCSIVCDGRELGASSVVLARRVNKKNVWTHWKYDAVGKPMLDFSTGCQTNSFSLRGCRHHLSTLSC